MKLRTLKLVVAALALAGLGSAVALATPPSGPPSKNPHSSTATTTTATAAGTTATTAGHKPSTTGANCRPQVTVIVIGTTTADVSGSSFSLKVTGGNAFAKTLFANNTSTTQTVTTSASTLVTTGNGSPSTLSSIKSGNRVLVQYRACLADLKAAKTASSLSTLTSSLTARKVVKLGGKA